MKSISTLFITVLIFSFIVIGLSKETMAGAVPPPPIPVCCANNSICVDNSLGPFLCPIGGIEVVGALCNENNECAPVQPRPPISRNVPALGTWGFIALAAALGIFSAVMIARSRRASA